MMDVDVILADAKQRRIEAASGLAAIAALVGVLHAAEPQRATELQTRERRVYDEV